MPHGEEIAHRNFHARFLAIVVIDAQGQGVQLVHPPGMAREPDVGDNPRAFQYRHIDRLTGHEPVHVEVFAVPPRLLIARYAAISPPGVDA